MPATQWKVNTIFEFNNVANIPIGKLTVYNGEIFGITRAGGTSGNGVIYKLTPPAKAGGIWTETILHSFSALETGFPQAGLLADGHGGFFGTAAQGGSLGLGIFYHLTPPSHAGGPWNFSVLHTFSGANDGATPVGDLFELNGAIFGTTEGRTVDGATVFNGGTVFEIIP